MEGQPTPTEALPSEAADASLTPAPEGGASSASPHASADSGVDMDAVIRQMAGQRSSPTFSLDSQTAAADSTDAGDDAQTGDASPDAVRPTGQQAPAKPRLSKLELAEQRASELAAENARLKAAYEAANPPPPDASETERQQLEADERRYRELLLKPDYELSGDDYQWREEQKELRAKVPRLQRQYEVALEADRTALQQQYDNAWNAVKADLSETLSLPGVTDEVKAQLLRAPLSQQVRLQRQLERRLVEDEKADEIARLRKENEQLRQGAMASTRAPVDGGRSSGPIFDMDNWIRQSAGVVPR